MIEGDGRGPPTGDGGPATSWRRVDTILVLDAGLWCRAGARTAVTGRVIGVRRGCNSADARTRCIKQAVLEQLRLYEATKRNNHS